MTATPDSPEQPGIPQDPTELFDIVDSDGNALGFARKRADVHRDGDWHRAVHVWIYGVRKDVPFLLFQRRSELKDTAPGRLDPTVGGHFGHGETIEDVWREVQEEIGVQAAPEEMRFAGVRVRSSESERGIIDREIQDVYLWRRDDPLSSYRPNPAELAALVEVQVESVLAVFAGDMESFVSNSLDAATGNIASIRLAASEIEPSVDRYPYKIAVAALAALRNDPWIAV